MNRTSKGPRGTGITRMFVIGVAILVPTLLVSQAPAVTSATVPLTVAEQTVRPATNTVEGPARPTGRDETHIDGATPTQAATPPPLDSPAQAPETPATVESATPTSAVKAVVSAARSATTAPPSVHLVALPSLSIDVSNARERYFSVTGRTPAAIMASARRNVPSDPSGNDRDSMAYVGPIVWKHVPSYVMDSSSGACTITGVASSTRYQATLPRWTSPSKVPAELLTWWRKVLRHIQAHESGHTRIFEKYVISLESRVVGQPCSKWQSKVTAWSAELGRAQASYDAAEASWVVPTYTGPKDW